MTRSIPLLLLLGACAPPTLAEFCDGAFTCFDFVDSQECQQVWLDPNDPATSCVDEGTYLECAFPCVDLGCNVDLDNCEEACWTDHCVAVANG